MMCALKSILKLMKTDNKIGVKFYGTSWYLFMVMLKLTPTVLENRPAAMIWSRHKKIQKIRQVLEIQIQFAKRKN